MSSKVGVFTILLFALPGTISCAIEPIRVDNGPRPSQTTRNWHVKEEWRAGNKSDDLVFGRIADVACDKAGRTYLLDYQQQETYVFGPKGKFQRVLGHKGEGPGETTMASRLLVESDRIGLMNRYPAEIVWLGHDGDPAGSVIPLIKDNPEAILGCWWSVPQADRIIWAVTVSTWGDNGVTSSNHIALCGNDGHINSYYLTLDKNAYTHGSMDGSVDEGRFFNPLMGRWDVDPEGRIWVAPKRDQYLLQVLNSEGRTVMESRREYDAPARSPEEVRKIRRSLEERWKNSETPIVVGDRAPSIKKLWIMENRWGTEVWVESGASHHGLPPGVMVRYDLFDLDGNFTHQVEIVCDGDPLFDKWYLAGNDRLIMVRNASPGGYDQDDPTYPRHEDDALEVISYRILWEE
jgi:hypothetical protein